MLAAAGVLKLIHQQVSNAVGDGESRFAWLAIFAFQYSLSDLRNFDEVHRSRFGKNCAQFARSVPQQREAGAHDSPIFLGVAGRGQMRTEASAASRRST